MKQAKSQQINKCSEETVTFSQERLTSPSPISIEDQLPIDNLCLTADISKMNITIDDYLMEDFEDEGYQDSTLEGLEQSPIKKEQRTEHQAKHLTLLPPKISQRSTTVTNSNYSLKAMTLWQP